MRVFRTLVAVACIALLGMTQQAAATIVITPTLPSNTIPEGTPTLDFVLSFDGTGVDTGASFDAFTYALIVSNTTRPGNDPSFGPISEANFVGISNTQFGIVDNNPAPNIAFGNVNANAGSGFSATVPSDVMSFTLNTSGLLAGDVVTIDANANGFAGVSLGPNSFDVASTPVQFTVVPTAIPEPGSLAFLGFASGLSIIRRRRRA